VTGVSVIDKQDLSGKRLEFGLAEDRLGHYPEFRTFFADAFDLEHKGLSEPGFVRAPSGTPYALVFVGRSGGVGLDDCRSGGRLDGRRSRSDRTALSRAGGRAVGSVGQGV
jgi:hypothetical protein